MSRRIIAAALSIVLAVGLCPGAALAASDLQAGSATKTTAAKVKESQTALGLFKYIRKNSPAGSAARADADAAIKILKGKIRGDGGTKASKSVYKKVKLKNSGDAASLKNFKASLNYIDKYNKYRKKENKAEGKHLSTKVGLNCRMMAISIVQCDWSKSKIAHSGAFNVGENLAWGYSNPFSGWYTEEKALYKKTRSEYSAGHYLNIVDKSTVVTGFAINTNKAKYGICHEQSFDSYNTTISYSTKQFRKKWLNPYCRR